MCDKCADWDIEVQEFDGMRAAINKSVNVFCPECHKPCKVLSVGLGDVVYVNQRKVATIEMDTKNIILTGE